jgi:hypothetical protein
MGRPVKVTKYSLLNAVSRSPNIAQTARYLGVDRHTVYDAARRFGVDLSTAFERSSTQYQRNSTPATPEPSSLPIQLQRTVEECLKRHDDTRRFRLADYTGPYRGDAGGLRTNSLLDRYQRLKGK